MYIPDDFNIDDESLIEAFIREHAFGSVITQSNEFPELSYLPFLLDTSGKKKLLKAHFAKQNPHWETIDSSKVLISFLGPHTYISHKDYGDAIAVPTWNYAIVNVYAEAKIISPEENKDNIIALLKSYEGPNHGLSNLTIDKFIQATVGVNFKIERYECKWKFSQNRNASEIKAMLANLGKRQDLESQRVLDFIRTNLDGLNYPY